MNAIIGFPKPQVACSIHAGGTILLKKILELLRFCAARHSPLTTVLHRWWSFMWGPYECFSSAELGDTEFYAYFFPIAGLRPSCERQRAVTAGNPLITAYSGAR